MTLDFDTILDKFKQRQQLGDKGSADRTVSIYATHIREWKDWIATERDKSLWNAEYVDLRVFVKEELHADGKAAGAINQRVSAISKFYQDCQKMQDVHDLPTVPENPYDGFDSEDRELLKGDTKKKKAMDEQGGDQYPYIEPEKVQKLVNNVPAPKIKNELIIKLLFNCGFRREELAQTKLEHIDRDEKSIYIPPMKSQEGRTVAYNYNYLGFQLDQWLDYGNRDSEYYASESDYLFPTQQNKHIPGDSINKMVKQAAKNAGIQEVLTEYSDGRKQHKITPHTLRHSYAMNAIESGISVKTLQTLMGHEELDTTLIYLQQSKQAALEASRQFDPTPYE